ncbi:MAG: hypothetical protein JNK29_13595, partial [Anaerolineales bacterium]|nr:hypothetical protein [Anaerolineales bacterium]
MKRWRGWAAVLILAASGCARERHAPSFVPPLDLAALPTSEVVVRFVTVTRTPTPAAPSQPAALPVEPAWGGAAKCLAPA